MKQNKKRAFCAETKGEHAPEEEEGPQLGVVSDSGPLGAGGQSAVAGAGTRGDGSSEAQNAAQRRPARCRGKERGFHSTNLGFWAEERLRG